MQTVAEAEENINVTAKEAQLSQRDCPLPRVIEYFTKSLKVIRNDTVE